MHRVQRAEQGQNNKKILKYVYVYQLYVSVNVHTYISTVRICVFTYVHMACVHTYVLYIRRYCISMRGTFICPLVKLLHRSC